jgi:hypothetical protein
MGLEAGSYEKRDGWLADKNVYPTGVLNAIC